MEVEEASVEIQEAREEGEAPKPSRGEPLRVERQLAQRQDSQTREVVVGDPRIT